MYDHIVIPVDGSDEAAAAARHGFSLAATFDSTVSVLHVVERRALRLTATEDERTRLQSSGEAIVDDVAALAPDEVGSVTTDVVEGTPADRITAYAGDRGADLIVVGRQGVSGLGKRLLGGVTERILGRRTTPVAVVPGGAAETAADYARILFPTDGSDAADAAVPHVAAAARAFGSAVDVLNVVDLQAAGGVFNAGGLEPAFVDRLERRGRDAVDAAAGELGASAPEVGIRTAIERATATGGAAAAVRDYVDAAGIDLVVMGASGRSNRSRQLLGSVTSSVLRTVAVPVLVVPRSG
ncbi:universal stress protein [Halobellus ruber]|uniref:Universal stress protein n=1 Tax=Halobellus ruber TaxID=2761102 RepID=A0A7J9SNR3_9EURY|nr:universal stress protein [Halobellus ruber]MBB6646851.1 universal stress protein [Halobellus ruber]